METVAAAVEMAAEEAAAAETVAAMGEAAVVVARLVVLVFLLGPNVWAQSFSYDENTQSCIDKETWLPGYNESRTLAECGLIRRLRVRQEDMTNRSLAGARIEMSVLREVRLTGADLRNTIFVLCTLSDSTLIRAKAGKASFVGAILENVDAKLIHAIGADFSGAKAAGAKFSGGNLESSRFVGADLFRASFMGANLANADFSGANVLLTDFRKAVYNKNTRLPFSTEEAQKRGMMEQ